MANNNLLSAAELAKQFSVDPRTARGWCHQGRFPNAINRDGRFWQIPRKDVDNFVPPILHGPPAPGTRICQQCGISFGPYRQSSNQRYCSLKCRDAAWSERAPLILRQHTINDNALDEWTPTGSYVLGLLAADGSVTNNNRGRYVTLSNVDKILPQIVRGFLAPQKPLYEYTTKSGRPLYCITVYSKHLVSRLIELGITPRKSATLLFPRVPQDMLPHFIRGYLDGDGTVFILGGQRVNNKFYPNYRGLTVNFGGTPEFLAELSRRLAGDSGIRPKRPQIRRKCRNGATIQYRSKESCLLFHYLYGPTPEDPSDIPHLPRKWQRFMGFKDYAVAKGYWGAE